MSTLTLFKNVTHWKTGETVTIAVEDGVVVPIPRRGHEHARVLDAKGAVLAPGLVDLHVHLREPGQSARETIETGTRAAAAGGFTAVACMPNTVPVVDSPAWVEWVRHRTGNAAHARVYPIAAVTVGQKGEQLAPLMAMARAGAVAYSDDGHPVASAAMMRRALEYAKPTGLPIVCHEEDPELRADGVMNEGFTATRLGLRGLPGAAESVMCRRDVDLAELTGARVHLAHLSTAQSFDALRDARRRGLPVTGETCPHYWILTDEAVGDYDTHAKMNPPLRSETDRAATIAAIVDGTIDCLVTDHAPHKREDKEYEFQLAPFGMVGLESCVGVTLTFLTHPGHLSPLETIRKLSTAPAQILRLEAGTLSPGETPVAQVTLIDPDLEWTFDVNKTFSKGKNTPFHGEKLRGKAVWTLCGSEIYRDQSFDEKRVQGNL